MSFHVFLPTSFPAIVEEEAVEDFVVEILLTCRGGGAGGSGILTGRVRMEEGKDECGSEELMTAE